MSDDQWLAELSASFAPQVAGREAPLVAAAPDTPGFTRAQENAPAEPALVEIAPVQAAPVPESIEPKPQHQPISEPGILAGALSSHLAAVVVATPNYPPEPTVARNQPTVGGVMPDLGILNALMADAGVGDILVNGTQTIYVDLSGKLVDSGLRFTTHEEVWEVAERIVKSVGQRIVQDRPMIDTRLPDGSRVNIVAPPMAVDGVSISIRKFPARQITLDTMLESGQITPELAKFLSECTRARVNTVVCGGTGSGKTTLLNALSAAISPSERIVTIEDTAELRIQQPHVVRLESKLAMTADKAHQAVTVRDLVKNALRMRPDRIIVGESRGVEALDILQAMNTGHDGSMTTLHANSPRDALSRLETMVATGMPQLPMRLVRQQIAGTVNLIIHMARCKDGTRRIMTISEIAGMEGETIMMQDLVVYTEATTDRQGHYRWANGSPRHPLIADAARSSGLIKGVR